MAKVTIQMLGGFQICVGGKPVLAQLSQSRKGMALVQYLLLHQGERVPHRTLTDALWAGERSTNPDMALRAILHRVRNMVEDENLPELKNCIVTSRGYYQWNEHLNCEVDIQTIAKLAEKARREQDEGRRCALYQKIVEQYKGRLLPAIANEPWVEGRSLQLHGLYRTAVLALVEQAKKAGDGPRVIDLCTRALELDPYAERLYLELIAALQKAGEPEKAAEYIRRGTDVGCLHGTAQLDSAAAELARQADHQVETDLNKISDTLGEGAPKAGAHLCDYTAFRGMYALQCGVQARFGIPVFLALVTLTPSHEGGDPAPETVMQRLGILIQQNLRQCDATARYSAQQYVVMLCGGTAESGAHPLERVKAAFYREANHGDYILTYRIHVPEVPSATPEQRSR